MNIESKHNTLDMTIGNPIKIILIFSIPLLIGNLFQQFYNLADTMIAGYTLGDTAISAIGSTSSFYSLIVNIAFGFNSGYAIVISRFFGKKDEEGLRRSILYSFILNLIIGVILTIFMIIFLKPMMHLIKVPDEIFDSAYAYFIIICSFIFASVLYNMFASIMRSLGNSRIPLYFLIGSSIVNILGDLLFVKVMGLGVQGLALSTGISQILCALISGIYFFVSYKDILPSKKDFKFDKTLLLDMLSLGLSLTMMSVVVSLGSVIFSSAINSLGKQIISAHTAGRKILGFFMTTLSCLGTAFSTFTSQNYGAKKYDRIKEALKKIIIIELSMSVFYIGLILLFGKGLFVLITNTDDLEIIKCGKMCLYYHFAFLPSLAILLIIRNFLSAVGKKILPIISSVMELVVKIIFAFFIVPNIGYLGVCLTEPLIWFVCMIYIVIIYLILFKKNKIFIKKEQEEKVIC